MGRTVCPGSPTAKARITPLSVDDLEPNEDGAFNLDPITDTVTHQIPSNKAF